MIQVSWSQIDSQDVILYKFPNFWTWDDFYLAQRKVDKMLEISSQEIPVFFDFREGSYLPPSMLREMSKIIQTWHPHGTPLIVVGGNQIIHNAFAVAGRMLSASKVLDDVNFVSSMPAAEAFLKRRYHVGEGL